MKPIHSSVINIILFLLLISNSFSREWTSPDGRKFKAVGKFWTIDGVLVKKEGKREFLLPYEKITYEDQKYAVDNLGYYVNDQMKLNAITISSGSYSVQKPTGKYRFNVDLYEYDGYSFRGTGTISEITKKTRKSGKVVEVQLSSFFGGDGIVGLEFYGLRRPLGAKTPVIYHSEAGVWSFLKSGSKKYFSAPKTEDFIGWVVIARSPNTGKIIAQESSMHYLEKHVINSLPEVAKIKVDVSKIKNQVLEKIRSASNDNQ